MCNISSILIKLLFVCVHACHTFQYNLTNFESSDILSVSNTYTNFAAKDILSVSNAYTNGATLDSASIPTRTRWRLGATEVLVTMIKRVVSTDK